MVMMYFLIISAILLVISVSYLLYKGTKDKKFKKQRYEYLNLRAVAAHEAIQKLTAMKFTYDLMKLLDLHKSLCIPLELNSNKNLGPCSWGMFRTKDIASMTADEVYLGDIYGLWTNTLTFWNNCTSDMSGNGWGISEETPCKNLIFNQYWKHLFLNLKSIETEANQELSNL